LRDLISTNKKLGVVVSFCHPNNTGNINRRISVQADPGINTRPYPKNNQSRKGWECGLSGREL
jgi:hypothetical protein